MDSPPSRILRVDLVGGIQSKIGEETWGVQEGLGSNLSRKRRVAELMISEELKVARIEGVGSDIPKGDDLRATVDIWDGRAWPL